ncbi:hypothetical protein V3C99_001942 [Haemonchus contortus]
MENNGKLRPFEALEEDYYMGEEARGGVGRDSEEELSSDDELQQELCKLAGIKRECVQKRRSDKPVKSEFEMDMECELDQLITDYANEHLSGNTKQRGAAAITHEESLKRKEDEVPALVSDNEDENQDGSSGAKRDDAEQSVPTKRVRLDVQPQLEPLPKIEEMEEMEVDTVRPSSSSTGQPSALRIDHSMETSSVKSEPSEMDANVKTDRTEESGEATEEDNPIKKAAKQTMKDVKAELPDFYDPDEDDQNEQWMQQQRKRTTGTSNAAKNEKEARPRIDGNSDAVLSCPGCMVLLTRDCQRHEIYNDQYRAMFVENCRVDQTTIKIEKTGKERRRERQKLRKMGVDPAQQPDSAEDTFLPVHCAVCSTNVAVMDHDEVYHFFNVLTGYA